MRKTRPGGSLANLRRPSRYAKSESGRLCDRGLGAVQRRREPDVKKRRTAGIRGTYEKLDRFITFLPRSLDLRDAGGAKTSHRGDPNV